MAKKETAEQQLLKMIEAGSSGPDAAKTQKKVARKQNILSVLKVINKALVVLIVAAALLVLNEVRAGMAMMSREIDIKSQKTTVRKGVHSSELMPTVQRLSYYLANINERNIFQPYEAKTKIVATEDKGKKIVRETASLRLVGIAWLDTVESASAMIEDTEKEVTHFLQNGEKVGDIIVKTIYADSVEVGYEDEELIIHYDKSQL